MEGNEILAIASGIMLLVAIFIKFKEKETKAHN